MYAMRQEIWNSQCRGIDWAKTTLTWQSNARITNLLRERLGIDFEVNRQATQPSVHRVHQRRTQLMITKGRRRCWMSKG
jgi:hypothetical protein